MSTTPHAYYLQKEYSGAKFKVDNNLGNLQFLKE